MQCGNPKLCHITEKKRIWRHWSQSSFVHRQAAQLVTDCGHCLICKKKRANELSMRCVLENSLHDHSCFLTLTYDEKKQGYENVLDYKHIQDFKKRFRSYVHRQSKTKIKIFNVHEYGKNGKKHWHLLVFGHDFKDKKRLKYKNGNWLYTSKRLEQLWPFGLSSIGSVTEASAMYQAQYLEKDVKNGNWEEEKKSKSNHSSLGRDWFLNNYRQVLQLGYIPFGGGKRPVPRYFEERIAKKHWAFFYDPIRFHDTLDRKQEFRLFNIEKEKPNYEMARLFIDYQKIKREDIEHKEILWQIQVENSNATGVEPDFVRSLENAHKRQKQLQKQEKF